MQSGMWISVAAFAVAGALGLALVVKPAAPRSRATEVVEPKQPAAAVSTAARPAPVVRTAQPERAPAPAADPRAALQDFAAARDQRAFELQQTFDTAPAADRRATGVRQDLERAISGAVAEGSRLASLECRLTICRAVLEFASLDANKAAFAKLLETNEGPIAEYGASATHETSPSGVVKTTLFVNLRKAEAAPPQP